MAKAAARLDDTPIDQSSPITDEASRTTIVRGDVGMLDRDYADRLAMGEEPVLMRIEPSTDQNAPHSYFCAVNGTGAECQGPDGAWTPILWVPVGVDLVMKRKYVEALVRAKRDRVTTEYGNIGDRDPHNRIVKYTSAVANVVILDDRNPKGPAMFAELRRRNY